MPASVAEMLPKLTRKTAHWSVTNSISFTINRNQKNYKFYCETSQQLKVINDFGGDLGQTYGVPVEEIQEGIRNGVRKVNIDTDNRLAFTAAVREAAFADKANFDPRHFNKPAIKYMKQVCLDRYKQLWCEGQASNIKQNSTNYFADLYAKGDLDPKVQATV